MGGFEMKNEGCQCQSCGAIYKVDINIPNDIWDRISYEHNLLCGSCIIKQIELVYNDYDSWNLVKTDYKCKYCKKKIDKKLYVVVIVDDEEILYHIECFHKNYSPIEEKFKS